MPKLSESRRFPRYSIQIPLLHRLKIPVSFRSGVGWTRNLSEGGACVELAERLSPQMSLFLVLRTDRRSILAEADVVWAGESSPARGGIPHGVAFTRIATEESRALRDLLRSEGEAGHAAVRLPLELSVTCRRKGEAGSSLQGWTGNISRAGLLLHLPQALPPGTELELTLHSVNGPLAAEGTIVWVEASEGRTLAASIRHGFRFSELGWSISLSLGLLLTAAQ